MAPGPQYGFKDFAGRLQAWMLHLGWSLQDLSRASGVHRAVIWKWQVGRGRPSFDSADAVLNTLRVPLREFFDDTPLERLHRAVEGAGRRGDGATLADVVEERPGDFLAAMTCLPLAAVDAGGPGVRPPDVLSDEGRRALVKAPVDDLDGYPRVARDGRAQVVAHGLSDLELKLGQWRFDAGERAALQAAWRRIEAGD